MADEQMISIILIGYLLIGFVVTGFQKTLEDLERPRSYMVVLWPLYLIFLIGYYICVGCYMLGGFIGEFVKTIIKILKS